MAWRLSPHPTADGRLFLGMRQGPLSLEVGVEATYPSNKHLWNGSGFRHMLVGGTGAICGHLAWSSACALLRASQVRVTGLGVDEPRSPNGFMLQAGLRLAAQASVFGPLSVALHVDTLGVLTPSTVWLNNAEIWETPRLGASAGFDVLVRFR